MPPKKAPDPNKNPVGRPRESTETLKITPVNLAPSHIAKAKRLGNGNTSAGVRTALEQAKAPK